MPFLSGKFARINVAQGVFSGAASGPYRWAAQFKRERLDTTNFESAVGVSGVNVHSEGLTGVLDTTFTVEGYVSDVLVNLLWPEASVLVDLLYQKNIPLGYKGVLADVLSFSGNTSVRDKATFTAECQSNGIVGYAA